MSDISRTTGASPKPTQEDAIAAQSETAKQAPPQETSRRFAQKMKKNKDDETLLAKREPNSSSLSSVMRQAKQKAQQQKEQADNKIALRDETREKTAAQKEQAGNKIAPRDEKREKTAAQKAHNILQGLQSQPTGQAQPLSVAATTGAEQTSAPAPADRLLHEFQQVADRIMHTSQSLQQGGSIRLQLANNVLPGTSVTFTMVAGELHVAFSGRNKKSLDKVRDNKEGLVSHVREKSGVNIVVSTENEQDGDQPDQQGSNS